MVDRQPSAHPFSVIEAVLFIAGRPLSFAQLAEILETSPEEVRQWIDRMARQWREEGRGIQIQYVGQRSVQLVANAAYRTYIHRLGRRTTRVRITPALLETLAVILYGQPITLAEINAWRGVDSSRMVNRLLRRGWIRVVGKKAVPGRPHLYGTTDRVHALLGIRGREDLPPWQSFLSDVQDGQHQHFGDDEHPAEHTGHDAS